MITTAFSEFNNRHASNEQNCWELIVHIITKFAKPVPINKKSKKRFY